MDEELVRVSKRLGKRLGKMLDRLFLRSLAEDFLDLFKELRGYFTDRQYKVHQPVNWDLDVEACYSNEEQALLLRKEDGSNHFVGQSLLVDGSGFSDQSEITIKWDESCPRVARCGCADALAFYKKQKEERGKDLFNGKLAGVHDWDPARQLLTFRKCDYFDYLQTNLALDFKDPLAGTLRQLVCKDGRLEMLPQSRLANPSGLNGLIFTNDGYMVVQERLPEVLIRANELCSGFSGTMNGTDIDQVLCDGGCTLARVNVYREMEEEIGVCLKEIGKRVFLGITREMLRGGMTEFFYAVEVNLSHQEVLDLAPKDKEGLIHVVHLGAFAACRPDVPDDCFSVEGFWSIVSRLREVGKGIVSVPLLTNLALWYGSFHPPLLSMQGGPPGDRHSADEADRHADALPLS